MSVENCKRCNRVFKKQHSPYCANCQYSKHVSFDTVYQCLEQYPEQNVHLSQIAEQCNLPMREVEEIFFSGNLGLAGAYIIYDCQVCDSPIRFQSKERRRLCPQCAIKMEIEGKLHMGGSEPEVASVTIDARSAKSHQVSQNALDKKRAALQDASQPVSQEAQASDHSSEKVREDSEHYGFKRLASQ